MPPLFILAPGRSFTSITCGMIGCHPQMYGLAEINLFVRDTVGELQELYRWRGRSETGILRSLAELAFSEQSEKTIETVRGWLSDNPELTTVELFRTMEEWAGGRGLVDKSPLYAYVPQSLYRIAEGIPEARFLHLTRHPGDTLKSAFQLRRRMFKRAVELLPGLSKVMVEHPEAIEKMWVGPHKGILEFLQNIPEKQQMRMRGEDLLSEPARRLAEIADWLGVASGKAEIDAMMHPENSPFAKLGPSNARYGNDPNFLEHPHLRPFTYKPRPLVWETESGEKIELSEEALEYARMFGY